MVLGGGDGTVLIHRWAVYVVRGVSIMCDGNRISSITIGLSLSV